MPSRKKNDSTHYLAMWDMLGLECIYNVTQAKLEIEQWEKELAWSKLKGEPHCKKPDPIPLPMLVLRAKFNSQRSYEIYEFNSDLSEKELRREFEKNPQPLVNWIREHGHKIFSDYVKNERKMIV